MASSDQLKRILDFLREFMTTLREGILFIGEPLDIAVAVIDIVVTTFFFYYILKIVRDSRAWQLLKGIIVIVLLGLLASAFGLNSIGFLLRNTISVFSIAFVVIFQPELRRALETMGRSGLNFLNTTGIIDAPAGRGTTVSHQIIEAIVSACESMAKTRTGALIVIERSTPLGDLQEQENSMLIDAPVSATMLKQIFYVGTPLHDGAVLIRRGRIAAARIHIPLSDNYHLRKDYGTRHRAAIGASEMGDAIAVVVSEERGTISLAVDGRLYVLDNVDALRTQLHRLFTPEKESKKRFGIFQPKRNKDAMLQTKPTKRQRGLLVLSSLLIAIGIWLYVQVTVNPIISKNFNVPLTFLNTEAPVLKGLEVTYPFKNIQVQLTGRKTLLDNMSNRDLTAAIDLNQVDHVGIQSLTIQIEKNTRLYTRTEIVTPGQVTVAVRPYDQPADKN